MQRRVDLALLSVAGQVTWRLLFRFRAVVCLPIFMLLALAICQPVPLAHASTPASFEPPPGVLQIGQGSEAFHGRWQYRWGDSPSDPSGALLWAQPDSDSAWQELSGSGNPPGRQGHSVLWLRTRLTGPDVQDPALQIEIIDQLCEAFLDGQLVYRFGQIDGKGPWAQRFLGYPVHYIPLGRAMLGHDYRGSTLTLRIYSEHLNIGLFGQQRIGTRLSLARELFRHELSLLIVGILLLAVGVASLILYAHSRQDLAYLSYGGFSFFVGLYALCRTKSGFWVDEHPLLSFYLELLAFYSCISCLLFFLKHIIGAGPLRLMSAFAWMTAIYEVIAWIVTGLGWFPVLKLLLPFQLLTFVSMLYALGMVFVALLRGNREARVFALGFLLISLFSAYDMLTAMGVLPRLRTSFAHFGHLAFVLSLGLILVFRFQRVHAELLSAKLDLSEKYGALQARAAEIEQLNAELRHQIEARSKSLVESLLGDDGSSLDAVPVLPADSVLNERYGVQKILGQGGMGVVYEVSRLSDGRRFAAKVLSGRSDRRDLARFAREGQLLARLNHPNLVRIVDVDLLDSRVAYLVMELVEGGTLAQRTSLFGQQSFALTVIRQIASALTQVHAAGIVHRDLKPANVLMVAGDEIQVKLADFGVSALAPDNESAERGVSTGAAPNIDMSMYNVTLDDPNAAKLHREPSASPGQADSSVHARDLSAAKDSRPGRAHGGLTQTGVIIGTPLYMAPELVRGAKLARPASDIFSLGIVAYELLTGELPSQQAPILLNLRSGQRWFIPLSLRCPNVPWRIAALIERCLDAAPEKRPTAQEICDAFDQS